MHAGIAPPLRKNGVFLLTGGNDFGDDDVAKRSFIPGYAGVRPALVAGFCVSSPRLAAHAACA